MSTNPDDYTEVSPGCWQLKDGTGPVIGLHAPGMTLAKYLLVRDEPPKRLIPKSVIVSRLIAADRIADAKAALDANPAAFARWFASDRPAINHDDEDAIKLLRAIGADPDVILAP